MPKSGRDMVTVSPPTMRRGEFSQVDHALAAPHAPYAHDWIMARFSEGLQIRLLRDQLDGMVLFQPGKLAWRPVEGLDGSVFVHDLRVAHGPKSEAAATKLWSVVEKFARYYGYACVLALIGDGPGLIAPDRAPRRGYVTFDEAPAGARLIGKVLQGPLPLPRFPRDWELRTAAIGPGIVLQTTGESAALEAQAEGVFRDITSRGLPVRYDRLTEPQMAQARAVAPSALYSVIYNGVRLGGPELSSADILRHIAQDVA